MSREVPVFISGGGLSGLIMALSLGELGIPSYLAERRAAPSTHPRAQGVLSRGMEILRSCGIADEVYANTVDCLPVTAWVDSLEDTRRTWPERATPGKEDTPNPEALIYQDVLEPLILKRIRQNPLVDVNMSTKTVDVQINSTGAAVTVEKENGVREIVQAQFVIAADGANSAVRESVGIGMQGILEQGRFQRIVFHADLTPWVGSTPPGLIFFKKGGLLYLTTSKVKNSRHRWGTTLGVREQEGFSKDPVDSVRRLLELPDLEMDIESHIYWEAQSRIADQYRKGPVFLVGDAAHPIPPSGSYNANIAIHDSDNLAWKIAAVLKGQASGGLLDTYEEERRPIAADAKEFARKTWEAVEEFQNSRESGTKKALARPRQIARPTGWDLQYAYRSSGIIEESTDVRRNESNPDDVAKYNQALARPGSRTPHIWLDSEQTRSTLDLINHRFTLLAGPKAKLWYEAIPQLSESAGIPIDAYYVDTPEWNILYSEDDEGAVLVRPDSHIVWLSQGGPRSADNALLTLGAAVNRALCRE